MHEFMQILHCLCFIEELRTALADTLLVVKSCAAQAALVSDGHLKVASGPGQNLKWAVSKLSHRNGRPRQAAPAAPAPPTLALLPMPTPVPAAASKGTVPAPTPNRQSVERTGRASSDQLPSSFRR